MNKRVERRNGTYGAVKYMTVCNVILAAWAEEVGIPNLVDPNKFHTTLIYSRKPIKNVERFNLNKNELSTLMWIFQPSCLALMDSSAESRDHRVLVMKLDAPELVKFHEALIKDGATHDFDDYVPHITLSYDVPQDFNLNIEMPPISFLPNEVYFEPLDLNWKE